MARGLARTFSTAAGRVDVGEIDEARRLIRLAAIVAVRRRMRFGVLGNLAAWDDGRPLVLGGLRQRGVLALLLDHGSWPLPSDVLVDRLWTGDPPATAASALRVHVAKLRASLREGGADIVTTSSGYWLDLSSHTIDAKDFEALIAQAAAQSTSEALTTVDRALALWRGDPYSDVDRIDALVPSIQRLRELRVSTHERRAQLLLEVDRVDTAVGELEALVREYPLRERLTELLMTALYRGGRQADALRAYTRLRTTLIDELGLEPGPTARQLEAAILRHDAALGVRQESSATDASPREELAPARTRIDLPPALESIAKRLFVGRKDELERLVRLGDHAPHSAHVAIITGPAGMGKTSLAAQCARAFNDSGWCVVYGWSERTSLPYESIRFAVDGLVSGLPEIGRNALLADRIESLAPLLSTTVVSLGPTDDLDSRRARLFSAVSRLLRDAAGEHGVVMVLDDVHLMDEASIALLRHLLRSNADAAPFVIATHRSGEPINEGWEQLAADLSARSMVDFVELDGLSYDEVVELVDALRIGEANLELVPSLVDATGGNPLFLRQIVSELDDPRGEGSVGGLPLPQSSRAAVAQRVDRLSSGCERLLMAGAVLGRSFDLGPATELADLDVEAALDAIDDALRRGLIEELTGEPDRFRFVHGLMEQVIYERLSSARRCRWHADARSLLGEGSPPARPEVLARHSLAALPLGNTTLAIDDAQRAAEALLSAMDFEGAADVIRRALSVIDGGADSEDRVRREQRCRLLVRLGRSVLRTDDAEGLRILGEAAQLARDLEMSEELAASVLGRFGRDLANDTSHLVLLEEARESIGADVSTTRAQLSIRLAFDRSEIDVDGRPRSLALEAVEIADTLGDDALGSWARLALSVTSRAYARASDRLALTETALAMAEQAGDASLALQVCHARLFDLLEMGEVDRVLRVELPDVEQRARRDGWARSLWYAAFMRAALALHGGADETTFEQLAVDAARIGMAAGVSEARPTLLGGRIGLRWKQQRLHELQDKIEQIIPIYEGIPIWRSILACSLTDGGQLDATGALVRALAANNFDDFPRGQMYVPSLTFLVRPVVALGDRQVAKRLRSLLDPFAGQFVIVGAGILVMGEVDAFTSELERV